MRIISRFLSLIVGNDDQYKGEKFKKRRIDGLR